MKKTMFKITAAIALFAFFLVGCSSNSAPDVKQSKVTRASNWETKSLGGFSSVAVYNPSAVSQLGNTGKKALLIVLHGCTQAYSAYTTAGLEEAADSYGMIVAAPDAMNKAGFQCWDYWGATKSRTYGDYKNVINLAKYYIDSGEVDPNQVYVSGLSSGGAFAMTTACLAPDIFSGMGIMAGPSAGTSSSGAFGHEGTVASTVSKCNGFAGTYASHFQTQVTVTVAGTSDNTVPQSYGPQNAGAMAQIYGATAQGETSTSFGKEKLFTINEKPVVSQLTVTGLGHAWAGGSGASGSYVEASNLNLGTYLAQFFLANNRRVPTDTEPPVVSNVAFADGKVSATATDNEGVVKVQFYANDTLIGEDTTAPYSVSWNTANLYKGNYTVKAVASDAVDNKGDSSISLVAGTLTDDIAPTVSISAPTAGQRISGTTTITASASDAQTGVAKVEFYVGNTKIGTDESAPYSVSWNSASVANGTYTIKAIAYDGAYGTANTKETTVSVTVNQVVICHTETADGTATDHYNAGRIDVSGYIAIGGEIGYSTSFTMYHLDAAHGGNWVREADLPAGCEVGPGPIEPPVNVPPTVSISNPSSGATVSGTVAINATASDTDGTVASVKYYINGSEIASNSWNTTATANGTATVKVVATDDKGATGEATVSVTVSNGTQPVNVPPTVTISSPANGATVSGTVSISANAADSDGTVASVKYYINGSQIASNSWDTTATANGSATVKVVATDDDGATGEAQLTVTVNNTSSFECKAYTSTNIEHVAAGRAVEYTQYTIKYAKTVGGGEDLGQLGSIYYSATTTVTEMAAGHFVKGDKTSECGDPITPGGGETYKEVSSFGANPGNLKMYVTTPANPAGRPVVVAMHGCGQPATNYQEAGWNELAAKYNFSVVYVEQSSSNNQNTCFNWFESGDVTRGQGEAESIKQMVDYMKSTYNVDASKVYVTGLSAGAYMSSVMVATYPDVFAGAGIIEGGAYGCAPFFVQGSTDAINRCMMRPGTDALESKTPAQWGDLVRNNNGGYTGTQPKIMVFHGTNDALVNAAAAADVVKQWTNVHGIDMTADSTTTDADGNVRKEYHNASGEAVVVSIDVDGMSHMIPVDPGTGETQGGSTGGWTSDQNIHSSYVLAKFWGIIP